MPCLFYDCKDDSSTQTLNFHIRKKLYKKFSVSVSILYKLRIFFFFFYHHQILWLSKKETSLSIFSVYLKTRLSVPFSPFLFFSPLLPARTPNLSILQDFSYSRLPKKSPIKPSRSLLSQLSIVVAFAFSSNFSFFKALLSFD
jgi:hypothetical protein